MSNAAKEYIVAARKFAAQFKGFLSIADELEKLESFELAAQEAQNRLAKLREEEDAVKQRAASIVAKADQEARQIIAEARDQAMAYHESHRVAAQRKIDDATAQAADIISRAQAVEAEHADKKAELASLDETIAGRRAEHDQIRGNIAGAHAEHARILSMIEELKAKF